MVVNGSRGSPGHNNNNPTSDFSGTGKPVAGNDFDLGNPAAVRKMLLSGQTNSYMSTAIPGESEDEKKREKERDKRETALQSAAISASTQAMLDDLQSIIDAAEKAKMDAATAIAYDTQYVNGVQSQIDTRTQNLAAQGLSVLTIGNTGLNSKILGLTQAADSVIFHDKKGFYVTDLDGTKIHLNQEQSNQVHKIANQTGAKDGSDPTVKPEAARLNSEFNTRDMVRLSTETITERNFREAEEKRLRATEAYDGLKANEKDPDAIQAAKDIIGSQKTDTTNLSAPAPKPNETQKLFDDNKPEIIAATLQGKPLAEVAQELGLPESELERLKQMVLDDPEVEQAVLKSMNSCPGFTADDIVNEGMCVAGVEKASYTPSAVAISNGNVLDLSKRVAMEQEINPVTQAHKFDVPTLKM